MSQIEDQLIVEGMEKIKEKLNNSIAKVNTIVSLINKKHESLFHDGIVILSRTDEERERINKVVHELASQFHKFMRKLTNECGPTMLEVDAKDLEDAV
jgi:hypothetical protein